MLRAVLLAALAVPARWLGSPVCGCIHVIGIGAGDPDYVTAQAVRRSNDTDVFFAMDKGEAKSDLVALRREICARFITEHGYRFVELTDPKRAADGDYAQAGRRMARRAGAGCGPRRFETNSDRTVSAPFWRGGTRRCTTARCGSWNRSSSTWSSAIDVIPGITAVQALTARHRIPLNDVGEPVLITTGRQLRNNGLTGSAVVMLDGECSFA